MTRAGLFAAGLLVVLVAAPRVRGDGDEAALIWQYEGYARIVAAAADAKTKDRRLLLGFSGSPE